MSIQLGGPCKKPCGIQNTARRIQYTARRIQKAALRIQNTARRIQFKMADASTGLCWCSSPEVCCPHDCSGKLLKCIEVSHVVTAAKKLLLYNSHFVTVDSCLPPTHMHTHTHTHSPLYIAVSRFGSRKYTVETL